MASPRDVLVAYSKQQATAEQVWRALMEHRGWYVPAGYAVERLHTTVSEGLTIFATEIPTSDSALILFTDPVAAGHADGAPIGPFMREFSGVKVFQALDNAYGSVRVNPHSPKSEGWYVGQDAFPLAKLWAQVVHLEQLLLDSTFDKKVPYAEIAAHPGFIVLINSESRPITVTRDQEAFAVAFTSPDRHQEFIAKQPPDIQTNLRSATLDGATLCKQLRPFDVSGVVIYYDLRNGFVLRKEEYDAVASAA